MVKYENERRCWGRFQVAAAGMPCAGCAWLLKYGYDKPHVDRMTERAIFSGHPCAYARKKRVASDVVAAAAAAKTPKFDKEGNWKTLAAA